MKNYDIIFAIINLLTFLGCLAGAIICFIVGVPPFVSIILFIISAFLGFFSYHDLYKLGFLKKDKNEPSN